MESSVFASVDLTALLPFLESILNSLGGIDGWVAGLGAIALLVVQRLGGAKFDLWGTVKAVLAKVAPKKTDVLGIPTDLTDHELEAVRLVIDKIKFARSEVVVQKEEEKAQERDGLLKRIFGDRPV